MGHLMYEGCSMVPPLNFPLYIIWFSFQSAIHCFYGMHDKETQSQTLSWCQLPHLELPLEHKLIQKLISF